MKVIRYALFFHFLVVLGLLAAAYAVPDLFLIAARAANDPLSGCDSRDCPAATQALGESARVQEGSEPFGTQRLEVEAAPAVTTIDPASEPVGVESPPISFEELQSELREFRPSGEDARLVDPVQSVSQDGTVEVLDQAMRLDPGLAQDAVARGDELQERLRIESELYAFVQQVQSGHPGIVRGVFVPDTLSMPVLRQPSDNPGFISSEDGVVTQFGMADTYGSIGLLAHNYLGGSEFFALDEGKQVYLVFGDGEVRRYVIAEVHRYQAAQPNSPYSDFYDLDDGGAEYSARELFYMMYNREGDVVFQTCIAGEGISTWGRLFVIATPA